MIFSRNIVCAEPRILSLRIFWMNPGMSMPVGQAVVHGRVVTEIAAIGGDQGFRTGQRWMQITKVIVNLDFG